MLKELVQEELKLLGLNGFEQPIFYNSCNGIRFEIGVGDIYDNNQIPRNEYIENALDRAITIYNKGIQFPELLVWEVYPQNDDDKANLQVLFAEKIAPVLPQEESSQDVEVDGDIIKHTYLYWDLNESNITIDKVFREIILGDLGGSQEFVSSLYLFDIKKHVMLYLYDDRGLDIVADCKDTLMPLYQDLNEWILDYDRETIDKIFKIL
ncbi:MAG TPA: DUF3885 domain-containing protein [Anaerovoracaceae bacterium]|nr:DUF3885 domain-containing protein [Anaerovoracaceae bacterium]